MQILALLSYPENLLKVDCKCLYFKIEACGCGECDICKESIYLSCIERQTKNPHIFLMVSESGKEFIYPPCEERA